MHQTRHTIAVVLISRHPGEEPERVEAGTFDVEGYPYELADGVALDLALAQLDFSTPELVRFRATAVPRSGFRRVEATIVASSRLDAASLASASLDRAEHLRGEALRLDAEAARLEELARTAQAEEV